MKIKKTTYTQWLIPGIWVCIGVVTLLAVLLSAAVFQTNAAEIGVDTAVFTPTEDLPLCRFGVNQTGPPLSIVNYDITALRSGWYVDYFAYPTAPKPNNNEYFPVIKLEQIGDNDYEYYPEESVLDLVAQNNPGTIWLIGNEPDRRDVQNDLEPHIYAKAYHDMYYLLKSIDPTAKVVAGTIVQPTPLRLEYLDMVLDSYVETYHESMPVDGWSIHNFILNEVSCDSDPANCWGAQIPPGIDAPFGEIVDVDENDNIDMFIERIWRFRQWMSDRGYRGYPLYLTEYGVLMPPDFGFPPERVNNFMDATFDFMLTATDPILGDPADGYRLVQRWSWYSTADNFSYNGWLFDPSTHAITAMGQNYANYTATLAEEIDLYPAQISTNPVQPLSTGDPVDLVLQAQIANSGNLRQVTPPVIVRFYLGDPNNGGIQIGDDQMVSLGGCGTSATLTVPWNAVPVGVHDIYVVVDPDGILTETNTENNIVRHPILVATEAVYLPVVAQP